MYCSNCGARLSDTDVTCPYCGSVVPEREEAAYMEHLNDLMEDTRKLADIPASEYKSEIKHKSRRALKIFLIVTAVFLTPGIFFALYRGYSSYRSHQEFVNETKFEKTYFPELNQLYETGDIEKCYDTILSLSEEKGFDAIFRWKHYPFVSYYGDYLFLEDVRQELAEGNMDEADLDLAFYRAITMTREIPGSADYRRLTWEEKAQFKIWQTSFSDFLESVFGLSAQMADELYPSLCLYDKVMYSECKTYVHSILPDITATVN